MTDSRLSGAAASALTTDQYELTMGASYWAQSMTAPATFDLFVRRLPRERQFLIAAGLADALDYLENVSFSDSDISFLRSLGMFDDSFLAYLTEFHFTGDVWAIPEGEVFFPGEPLLRVTAPLIEAQLVETVLLATIGHQSAIASKAARVSLASGERSFMDFAARRAHGADAALLGARAAYLAGAASTSNVLAGKLFDIPLSGTMAHSYVMAFDDEREAFRQFARQFPRSAVLLIDTYDTVEGARRVVEVAHELESEGVTIAGVRIDSGDLAQLSVRVRDILDEGNLAQVRINVSGDLDEHKIAALNADNAPIDSFGVGTQMGVSADAPALGAVYKLVEYNSRPVVKLSTDKATLPGRKQVWRTEENGILIGDTIGLDAEDEATGRPLLEQMMASGKRTAGENSLLDARARCARSLASLPARLRELAHQEPDSPVQTSVALDDLAESASHITAQ